jgi:hypothetical protein
MSWVACLLSTRDRRIFKHRSEAFYEPAFTVQNFFMPECLSELIEAVRREKLTMSGVFAMHTGLTPWSEIEAAVVKANAAR